MAARSNIVARALLALSLLVIAFGQSAPANAEIYADQPNGNDPYRPVIEGLAKDLAAIPASFGCEFAWGQVADPTSVTLEFAPRGHDVRKWTRLVTITTVGLPPAESGQVALMKELHAIMLQNFGRGRILQTKTGVNPKGMPALYVEYEIGSGAAKEHAAAGIYKVRPNLAAIIQIQSRGKPLAREDAAKMNALAIPAPKN